MTSEYIIINALSSSSDEMVEHFAINHDVVGSNPTQVQNQGGFIAL